MAPGHTAVAMKRVGGRGRGWSDGGDGRVGFGAEPSGSHQSLPTRAPLRSPRSREAHDRGTRRSRRFLAGLVVGCVLLAAGRPVYGPYIDRFGETGDKGVIAVVKTSLRKRAERHDLTTLPRSWGHHRDGPDGEGEVVGAHVSQGFSWRRAYDALSHSTVDERERVIRALWDKLVAPHDDEKRLGEPSRASSETRARKPRRRRDDDASYHR